MTERRVVPESIPPQSVLGSGWRRLCLRSSLHVLEIVEVARYFGPEPDGGICTPGDRGHHFTLRVQNDCLCRASQSLAIRTQLYIDPNLRDGRQDLALVEIEGEHSLEEFAVTNAYPKSESRTERRTGINDGAVSVKDDQFRDRWLAGRLARTPQFQQPSAL
jgi:hypothetical protein